MKVIAPIDIDDSVLTASNIAENDHPEWVSGTTYTKGARVIVAAQHKVYESAADGNVGNDPTAAPAGPNNPPWLLVGATNRYKAWDRKIGQSAERAGSITYELTLPGLCTGIGLLGLEAGSVRVHVSDGTTAIFDETQQLVDASPIVDYFSYYTYSPEYVDKAVFTDIPGYVGYKLTITIDAGAGTARIGEIAAGKLFALGITGPGTEDGFEDLSSKERDTFGNIDIVERDSFDVVAFRFAVMVGDEGRVKRILKQNRARAALYFADEDILHRGVIVYGFPQLYRPPLAAAGITEATLEIQGLV